MSPWLFAILAMHSNVIFVHSTWPSISSSSSNIKLLGLFQDPENVSQPTSLSVHPRAMFLAAVTLAYQYNIKIHDQFLDWQVVQTAGDRITALRGTCQTVSSSNIVGIVGPTYSREAHLIASFCGNTEIPAISHAATDPDLSDRSRYPAFHRTIAPDNTAAVAIGKLFTQYNWTSAVIMYQNDAFGSGGAKAINQVLTDHGVSVRQTIIFDLSTNTFRGDFKTLITSSSTRIIVLWADIVHTEIIFQEALANDVLGPQYVWISGSSISFNSFNQSLQSKFVGILTVEPVVGSVIGASYNSSLLTAAYNLWQQYEPDTFPGVDNVDFYAIFGFDAAWTLILSLQKLCSSSTNLSTTCTTLTNASICFDRRFINSQQLLSTIDGITFLGVSGPVQFTSNSTDRITGIYYIAKNSQLIDGNVSFVPVLKYSDTNTWDLYNSSTSIIWPGNSSTVPTDHIALEGVALHIGIIESIPFTQVSYQISNHITVITTFSGYMPDFIALLQAKMEFIPNITLVPSTKTYADAIIDVSNGVYDMLIADIAITATRREVVSFSQPIFDNSVCIVMRQDAEDPIDLLAYLRPFTRNLWLLLLGSVVYGGVLVCVIERQENETLKNRSVLSLLFMGMWFAIGVIIGYGVDFHVRTAAGRLLTAGLYILSIVFVATYTANLASFLTLSNSKAKVSSLDDIKTGQLTFSRIGVPVDTAIEDYYLREVSGGTRNFYPIKSLDDQFELLINETVDAIFMDKGLAEYAVNSLYCNLTIIGTDFDKSAFGIVMPKNWIYVQDVDIAVLSLRENGYIGNLREKWFTNSSCSTTVDSSTALGIEDLAGLFLTFAVVCVLSILLFFWIKRRIIKERLFECFGRK